MQRVAGGHGYSHWDDEAKQWRLDENEYSAALSIVNSVKPRNEMEACLAAQMEPFLPPPS